MPLKRYDIKTDNTWAIVVLDTSIGFFSAVSDYGNYAYIWSAPGEEFRKFLINCDEHYFWSKMMHMRNHTHVWDDEKTEQNVRKELDRLVAEDSITKESADLAFDEYQGNVDNSEGLLLWIEEWNLRDFDYMEGIIETKPDPTSWGFATKFLPLIKDALRAELEKEAADAKVEAHA